jgi:hypothetical protein
MTEVRHIDQLLSLRSGEGSGMVRLALFRINQLSKGETSK